MPGVLAEIYRISERYGLAVANVFHAGDGNLHPLILFDSRRQDQVDKILDMGGDIMKVCVAAGGALSGEHGIGIEKKEFMGLVFNDADLDVMMQVKNVFNPARAPESFQDLSHAPVLHGDRKGHDDKYRRKSASAWKQSSCEAMVTVDGIAPGRVRLS